MQLDSLIWTPLVGSEMRFPFVSHTGPWRIGDRVAFSPEYCTRRFAPNPAVCAARRRWRGIIVSCDAGNVRGSFLVMTVIGRGLPDEGEVYAQHPHFLRKLGR